MPSEAQSYDLLQIARRALLARGFLPDFSSEVLMEVERAEPPTVKAGGPVRDLRDLLWCSIDNEDSQDIDQITYCERLPGDRMRVLVAVADVDALVTKGTATDGHARTNTTSIYTGVRVFPMLPERLSTDLTSLREGRERPAVVAEMVVDSSGGLSDADLFTAVVENKVELEYDGVGRGLEEGAEAMPAEVRGAEGLDAQLRLQDEAARRLRERRHERGAIEFETWEPRPVVRDGKVVDLVPETKNRARELIEDFMIAANSVAAAFLEERGLPSIRRVVRSPKRWSKIVEKASSLGHVLPQEPDSKALARFLRMRRKEDPDSFPELSLTVIKLMGPGEYVVDAPSRDSPGHFALAVKDYTHSTAPNRRFPDLVIQRLLKAAIAGKGPPYEAEELGRLARHCTEREKEAEKVERQVKKSAAAVLMMDRIGEHFEGIVTGASEKGTWARVFRPPVEGKVIRGWQGLDVGDRIRLELVGVDVERGFIDFAKA